MTVEQLTELLLLVAREAGHVAAAGFRQRPEAAEKRKNDLVTEFDVATERWVRRRLGELTPDLPVFAEEEGGSRQGTRICYVDPIDGTTNFVHGHPFWAVSIGVLEDDEPLAGAVVAPSLGLEWSGYRGGPALRNGEVCRVSPTPKLGDSLVATGFPQDRSREPDNNFDSYLRVKRAVRGVRRCGSASIDMCLVADGTYDGYWERRLNTWDLAAGAAIVRAAGGHITALDGGAPVLHVGHIVASNGLIHDELVATARDR